MFRHAKFILTVLRQVLIREMQFRTNFLMDLVISVIQSALLAIFYSVLLGHNLAFQVWQENQVMLFVGTFLMIHNLFNVFLSGGVGSLSGLVRSGDLDGLLLRPFDARFLLAFSGINIAPLASVGLGLALTVRSGLIAGFVRSPALGIAYFILVLLGVYFLYIIYFVLMCSSFWIVKTGELNGIFEMAIECGNKPYMIYPKWLQFLFSSVLAFFLAGNYQVLVLTGRFQWTGMLLMLISLGLWSLLGRFLWNRGIRRYHGASR